MRKEFLPFYKPFIGQEEIEAVTETLKSGWLTMGPKTRQFEKEFFQYIGTKHAVAVNSCTSALHLALIAYGIKQGDEVITTPFTFASTAEVILYTGAKPVFVDIDENTFNIDPTMIESAITSKTRAIIPVHIAGQPCEMDKITQIAKEHKLLVIEDAAHSLSSEYKGRKIGKIGDATCFSFYATKNLTTGEGGMITTNKDEIADKVRIIRLHGMSRDAWKRYSSKGSWYYEITDQGYKYNMTDIQASIGLCQLRKLSEMQRRRKEYVNMYNEAFSKFEEIATPYIRRNIKHSWHLYVIQIRPQLLRIDRDEFIEQLRKENIGTSVHFIPLHLMPFYQKNFGFKKGDFPKAESVYERVISLPLYPGLAPEDVEGVIRTVIKVIKNNRK